MSDEITTTEEPAIEVEVTDEPQGSTDATDWKAEARKWEKRAKDASSLKEAADKWHEYEAAQKPAQERMAEELQATKVEAESARTALLRYEIASEKNIPAEAIKLLSGSTREELEEAADALVALMAIQSKPTTPAPDVSQGKEVIAKLGQLTKDDLVNMTPTEILAAKAAGRLDTVLGK